MNKKTKFAVLALAAVTANPIFLSSCTKTEKKAAVSPPPVEETFPETEIADPPFESPEETVDEIIAPAPEPEPEPISTKAEYICCTKNNVNIRSGAGTGYAVIGRAEKGTNYVLLENAGTWYKIYHKNKTAYIHASCAALFELEKADEKTEKVLAESYKTIGTPYVYGATRLHDGKGNFLKGFTAEKFDCSSLVQYVFYKGAGVLLNTTTRTQVKQGTHVKPADLKRGDCIYFTNAERQYQTGIERVGHVAIYLGENYILHTSSDYARIEKISAVRWNYYIEARRFL